MAKPLLVDLYLAAPSAPATMPGTLAIVEMLRRGLLVREARELQRSLKATDAQLAGILGISRQTLKRRLNARRLTPAESERVIRFARLVGIATAVFKSADETRSWFTHPQIGLGGHVPLELAEWEIGAQEVEHLLGRIQHGVFS